MKGLGGWLVRTFVRDWENVQDARVRKGYGTLSGGTGILLNSLLSAGKFLAGSLSGSLAMMGDALNNLTDAGSSVVTLVGFRLAGQKADADHPFGHGRAEYVSGLIVSLIILLVGFELGQSSVEKIIHPEAVSFSWVSVGVLTASILVKLWMWRFNRSLSVRIGSEALDATAQDSLSDCAATGAVLLGSVIGHLTRLPLDGWLGLAVAGFICRTGYLACRDTLDPLMGRPPSKELVAQLADTVKRCPEIVGIHDLVVHDYGPGRVMASLHAEVPMTADILAAHDAIDAVERQVREECGVELVIHMDPIATHDERVNELREQVAQLARSVHPELTIHDFRMTDGPLHTNLIFDVVEPYSCPLTPAQLVAELQVRVKELDSRYYAVVEVDRPFVEH